MTITEDAAQSDERTKTGGGGKRKVGGDRETDKGQGLAIHLVQY